MLVPAAHLVHLSAVACAQLCMGVCLCTAYTGLDRAGLSRERHPREAPREGGWHTREKLGMEVGTEGQPRLPPGRGPGPDPPAFWMWASSLVTAAEALSPHRFSEKTRKEYELPTTRSETVQVVGW